MKNVIKYTTSAIVIFLFTLSVNTDAISVSVSKEYNSSLNVSPGSRFILNGRYGKIKVQSWDQMRIKVETKIDVKAKSKNEAQIMLDNIQLELIRDQLIVELTTDIPIINPQYLEKKFFGMLSGSPEKSINIEYEIWVPEEIDVEVRTTDGEIEIQNVKGNITAVTTGNPIELKNINGSINAFTTNSNIIAEITGLNNSSNELSTANADVEIILPDTSGITFQANAENGEITSDFDTKKRGIYTDTKQYGWINGGGVKMKLFTRGGMIKIRKR